MILKKIIADIVKERRTLKGYYTNRIIKYIFKLYKTKPMIALQRFTLHPLTRIILFGILVFASAMLVVPLVFFNPIVHKATFSLIIVSISILLLKTEGRSFRNIGIKLTTQSCQLLAVGMLIGLGMMLLISLLTKGFVGFSWQSNPATSFSNIFLLLNFYFWSALVEELWFRGYGFQRLTEYKGRWVALISVGFLFGLYHINPSMTTPEVLSTLLTTGLSHVFFGLAVLRMKNLALPLGLHMGWNVAQELMPRHPSLNSEDSILHVAQTSDLEYTELSLIAPYLIIVIFGCLFLLFDKKIRQATILKNNT